MKIFYILIFSITFLNVQVMASECPFFSFGMCESIDKAINDIDNTIGLILRDSERWQEIVGKLGEKLPKDIQETFRDEIDGVVSRAVIKSGAQIQCQTEFFTDHIIKSLERLKAIFKGGKPPVQEPVICNYTKTGIDLNVSYEKRTVIEIVGYNFDHKDSHRNKLKFVYFDDNGENVGELSERYIGRSTHNYITLNISQIEIETILKQEKVSKIKMIWNNEPLREGTSGEILVIQPRPKKCSLTIKTGELLYTPKHIRGDQEFDTDEDNHMDVTVKGEGRLENNQIKVRVYMHARESDPDHTEVESWSDWDVRYTAPYGWKIISAWPLEVTEHRGKIFGEGEIIWPKSNKTLVRQFNVWGDHGGDEAGFWTRVNVDFNDIKIELEEIPSRHMNFYRGECSNL